MCASYGSGSPIRAVSVFDERFRQAMELSAGRPTIAPVGDRSTTGATLILHLLAIRAVTLPDRSEWVRGAKDHPLSGSPHHSALSRYVRGRRHWTALTPRQPPIGLEAGAHVREPGTAPQSGHFTAPGRYPDLEDSPRTWRLMVSTPSFASAPGPAACGCLPQS